MARHMASPTYAATPLGGRTEMLPDRTVVRVNRIRYPRPNTLGIKRTA